MQRENKKKQNYKASLLDSEYNEIRNNIPTKKKNIRKVNPPPEKLLLRRLFQRNCAGIIPTELTFELTNCTVIK